MCGESPLDRQIFHDHIFHLQDMQPIGNKAEDETTVGEVLAGADVRFSGKEVAEVVVDGGVVLDHMAYQKAGAGV
jgi:hypothetical protein